MSVPPVVVDIFSIVGALVWLVALVLLALRVWPFVRRQWTKSGLPAYWHLGDMSVFARNAITHRSWRWSWRGVVVYRVGIGVFVATKRKPEQVESAEDRAQRIRTAVKARNTAARGEAEPSADEERGA